MFSGKTIQNSALNLRLTLYIQSIDVFLNNILIGALNNNFVIGGHSTWLDFLGQIGLLSCPIYVFFVMCYLYIKKTVPKNTLVYVKACFIYIFFLGFINTVYIARILLTLVVFVPFAAKVLCENENI